MTTHLTTRDQQEYNRIRRRLMKREVFEDVKVDQIFFVFGRQDIKAHVKVMMDERWCSATYILRYNHLLFHHSENKQLYDQKLAELRGITTAPKSEDDDTKLTHYLDKLFEEYPQLRQLPPDEIIDFIKYL